MKKVMLDVAFHQGRAIMDIARTYPSLLKVLLEVVQNAIDSGARRIELKVNQQDRYFSVFDNGSGCGLEKFQKALRSLNKSTKERDKYGQFGRGLVSPLPLAQAGFTFTSCEHPHHSPYYTYTFDPKKIEAQQEVKIQGEEQPQLKFNAEGRIWWRTCVEAKKLTRDRRLTSLTLKELVDEISLKYGEAILERNILISVTLVDIDGEASSANVVVSAYSGEKIGNFEVIGEETGKTVFELYIARLGKSGRKGKVVIGTLDNPSRVSMKEFIDNTRGGLLKNEVGNGLYQGSFEGTILSTNLKLNPDRTRFEDNEALAELCIQIEAWWDKYGKEIVAELKTNDDDSRFQKLGISVMPFAELLLRQDRFKDLANSIHIGTIGKGHADVPDKDVLGKEDIRSVAKDGNPFEENDKKKPRKDNGDKKPLKPEKDHPKHFPGIVYGPRGTRRTEVKGSSTGLRFSFIEMQDVNIPFTFEPNTGTLTFNLDHPDWAICEDNDTALVKYEIAVIATALSLELHRDGNKPHNPSVLDYAYLNLHEHVFAIMNGEAMLKK